MTAKVSVINHHLVDDLRTRLPAACRNMDKSDYVQMVLGDVAPANAPVRPLGIDGPVCSFLCGVSAFT